MQPAQLVYSIYASPWSLRVSVCFSLGYLFVLGMRSLARDRARPETEPKTETESDQASAALFLLPARLKLITGHKSWPAYQRQRQRQRQRWPDPQLVAMP